jgi:FSR family fosmidomycin resistance protein-like MFS transporter
VAVDAYANVIGPLMVVFAAAGIFSEDNAKLLPAIMAVAGSLTQPLVGLLADRGVPRSLLLSGPAFAAGGIALAMVAGTAWLVVAMLIVGGIGVAIFHPESAVLATLNTGRRSALAMSVFLFGGTIGLWLGPVACGYLVDAFGLTRAAVILGLPGLVLGVFLNRSRISRVQPEVAHAADRIAASRRPGHGTSAGPRFTINWPLASLTAQAALRAMAMGAVAVVVPWWGKEHGATLSQIGHLSGLFLFSGGLGMLLMGWLCRPGWEKHWLVLTGLAGVVPVVLLSGAETILWAAIWIAAGGALTNGVNALIVSMAQRVAPRGARTASALTMGFAWGLGGAGGPLLVWLVGDNATALWISAGALVPAAVLAAALPALAEAASADPGRGSDAVVSSSGSEPKTETLS